MLGLFLFIVFLCVILSYAIFFPRVNAIYKDKDNAQVKVCSYTWKTVTIQYVEYDAETGKLTEITNNQNIGMFEFIKNFELWIIL